MIVNFQNSVITLIIKTILVIGIVVLVIPNIQAQETIQIDLAKALEMGGANNATVDMMRMKMELAQAEYKLEKKWWLPDLYAGISAHQLWGNAMNGNGLFFTDVNRQNISGAIGFDAEFDFAEGRGKKGIKKFETQSAAFRNQMDRNDYLLSVIENYYQLLANNFEADAYRTLILQSNDIIKQLDVLVKQGLQYNTDLLLARSNRENHRFQMSNAEIAATKYKAMLLNLLYKNPDTQIELIETVLLPIDLVKADELNSTAISNSPLFRFLENQRKQNYFERNNLKWGTFYPTIRINGYTSLFGDIFEQILPTHSINGSIGWDIPLTRFTGDDMKVLDIKNSIIEQEVAILKNEVTQEVAQLQSQMTLLKAQIQSTESGMQDATTALAETIARQKLGLARPFEIEWAQESFIKSKINYLKSVAVYNVKQYEVYVLLGNNL